MPYLYWYRFGLPLAALANSSEHASHGDLFPIRQCFHESHPLRRAPLLPFATSGKPTHFPSLPLPSIPHKPHFSSSRDHSKAFLGKLLRRSKHPEKEKIEGEESARNGDDSCEKLPSGVRRELLPRHVAVIMDGNSRWAKTKGLPTWAGHEAGYRSLQEMVKLSCRWGIRVLTVFAFSFENWLRPKVSYLGSVSTQCMFCTTEIAHLKNGELSVSKISKKPPVFETSNTTAIRACITLRIATHACNVEVDFLMVLIEGALKENIKYYLSEGIRVRIIGDSSRLPNSLQKIAKETQEKTKTNSRLELNIAVGYSGRKDITQACQKIAWKVQHGLLDSADISESLIDQELETNRSIEFPCPDLLIRTGGELRLSNFLLWQSAYTELFFTKTLWPDFGEPEYIEVLCSFQERERRFGQRIT